MSDVREDNYLSFKNVESKINLAVKSGELTTEKARDILTGAKYNYANATAQKTLDRRKHK